MSEPEIQSVLKEARVFPPPAEFSRRAHVKSLADYQRLCEEAAADPEGYWARVAGELQWERKWTQVLDWRPPFSKWFVGGKLNLAVNCIDRHLDARGDKPAIVFEGEPGDERVLTFKQLHAEVCKFAGALRSLGGR